MSTNFSPNDLVLLDTPPSEYAYLSGIQLPRYGRVVSVTKKNIVVKEETGEKATITFSAKTGKVRNYLDHTFIIHTTEADIEKLEAQAKEKRAARDAKTLADIHNAEVKEALVAASKAHFFTDPHSDATLISMTRVGVVEQFTFTAVNYQGPWRFPLMSKLFFTLIITPATEINYNASYEARLSDPEAESIEVYDSGWSGHLFVVDPINHEDYALNIKFSGDREDLVYRLLKQFLFVKTFAPEDLGLSLL